MPTAPVDLLEWLCDEGRHPLAVTLARAWLGWRRASDGLPSVAAIDPLDMPSALPWVWIWAKDEAGVLRLRLVGEEAKRAIGNWQRGRALHEVCPPALLPKVSRRYAAAMEGPAALGVAGSVMFDSGATAPAFRLILPLGRQANGATVAEGVIGVTSYAADLRRLDTGSGLRADLEDERILPLDRMA